MKAWRIPLLVAAAILTLPVLLGALPFEAQTPTVHPLYQVKALDSAALADDWETAHSHFDYRARSRAMLPDLWDAADESERADMVAFLKPLFQQTWTKAWTSVFNKSVDQTVTRLAVDRAIVDQTSWEGGVDHTFRYWLELREETEPARWQITDRTRILDGIHRESSGLVKVIRKRIRNSLGREPTLREFVINAPSWMERVRVRTIKVDDLMK